MAHSKAMTIIKREEAEIAETITEDHVRACDKNMSLGDIFPSIQASQTGVYYLATPNLWLTTILFQGLCVGMISTAHDVERIIVTPL